MTDTDTFDPCSSDGSNPGGSCSTCPMAEGCIPAPAFEVLDDFFRDPAEPEDARKTVDIFPVTTETLRSFQ